LYVKSKFLARKRPNRALSLISGAPITNTMGELFSLLRFMHKHGLALRNV
jgi:N12 class adenine-specific DNA methylase